jgi:hypothetical protein
LEEGKMGYILTDNKNVVRFILSETESENIEYIAEDLYVYKFKKTYIVNKRTEKLLKIDKKKIIKCRKISKEELLLCGKK